ncbi:MAG: hypothetical protein CMJ75_07700 [Planctomycetaceae bacterium]|nr:hypothetical protein [Planctomycetaceae bacterium]
MKRAGDRLRPGTNDAPWNQPRPGINYVMGRRKARPRNRPVSRQTKQTDVTPIGDAPDPVNPPRPQRPLLAFSIGCFLLWFAFLLYATLARL